MLCTPISQHIKISSIEVCVFYRYSTAQLYSLFTLSTCFTGKWSEIQRQPPTKAPAVEKLHPSWEAKRKKKEQEAKPVTFEGKKITFDDD